MRCPYFLNLMDGTFVGCCFVACDHSLEMYLVNNIFMCICLCCGTVRCKLLYSVDHIIIMVTILLRDSEQ